MNKSPLVSVIMPFYNEEKFIRKAIDSILKQSYSNLEIIVIDDYSDDNSFEIVKEISLYDNRVKLISKQDEPRRAGVSRNIGVKLAKGEYVAFQDADDYSEPNRIEIQLKKALEMPGKILVGSNIKVVSDKGIIEKLFPENHQNIIKGFHNEFGRGNYFVMGTALGPKHLFLNNPCKENLRYLEDWDQLLRIYENEKVEIYNVQKYLYHYNHIGGLSDFKPGWIESNLFVRFSQNMRKNGYKDPSDFSEIIEYLHKKPIQFLYFNFLKTAYFLKSKIK